MMKDPREQTRSLLRGMSSARLVTIAETPAGPDDYSVQLARRILRARNVPTR